MGSSTNLPSKMEVYPFAIALTPTLVGNGSSSKKPSGSSAAALWSKWMNVVTKSPVGLGFGLFPPSPLTTGFTGQAVSPGHGHLPSYEMGGLSAGLLFGVLFKSSCAALTTRAVTVTPPFLFGETGSPTRMTSTSGQMGSRSTMGRVSGQKSSEFAASTRIGGFSSSRRIMPLYPMWLADVGP